MTLDTEALIRDIKSAYESRLSSVPQPPNVVTSKSASCPGPFKSAVNAVAFREAGNRFYKEKKFTQALMSYTISVATAFEGSEELCKAYGNRSAVLFELKAYESCLLDINRALKVHCPNLSTHKLLDRKERCLARMESAADASDAKVDADETNPCTDRREPTWRADMLAKLVNPLLPNASPKIKLKYDEKWGRHLVATADINPGEILSSEELYVAVMFTDESRFKFCDFCVMTCVAMIPCPSCAMTLYCSEQCRTMAYNRYHRMECELVTSSIIYSSSFDSATAIRLFLVGTEQGAALENLMNNLSVSDIFEENYDFTKKPFTSDYVTALRMTVGTFDPTFVKSRIEDAVGVVIALRKSAFFESVPVDRLEEAEVFATALLLNNYKKRHVNRLAISRVESPETEGICMGEGLVLLQYSLNHSCYPNVFNYRRKRENIIFSVRPIKKNEQIFSAYSDTFVDSPRAKRLEYLDFDCQCEACIENWPTLSESGVSRMSPIDLLLNIKKSALPEEEGHEFPFSELMNVSTPFLDDTTLKRLRVAEILPIIVKVVSLLHKLIKPMSYPLIMFRYYLAVFMKFFYDEYERDLTSNEKLRFPISKSADELNDLFMRTQRPQSTESSLIKGMIRILHSIGRMNFYLKHGHFIKKKIVD